MGELSAENKELRMDNILLKQKLETTEAELKTALEKLETITGALRLN